MTPISPLANLSATEIAKWLVTDFPLVKAGEILTALSEEIEGVAMDDWLDEDGNPAGGSLQSTAAYNACAELEAYLKTLTHRSDVGPSMAEQHRLFANELVDMRGRAA